MTDSRYCVVVAHPDDEILFFSSLLNDAETIITCFGPSADRKVSAGRQQLKGAPPLERVVYLDRPEADVWDQANWRKPVKSPYGLAVRQREQAYRDNFAALVQALDGLIADGMRIYTHNPWGEYGHEEHVQVFRAVETIAQARGLELFVDGYVSDKSFPLAALEAARIGAQVQVGYPPEAQCQQIMAVYQAKGCWTWADDYAWPKVEVFLSLAPHAEGRAPATAYPPLTRLSRSFRQPFYVKWGKKLLPEGVKKAVKRRLRGGQGEP